MYENFDHGLLQQLIAARGWMPADFYRALTRAGEDITEPTVRDSLKGARTPSPRVWRAYAKFFGVTPESFCAEKSRV